MAKAPLELYTFRIRPRFYSGEREIRLLNKDGSRDRGFTKIEHTPNGLAIWLVHEVGEPMAIRKLEGVNRIDVRMVGRSDPSAVRTVRYVVSSPESLAVTLDASSLAALEGILFRKVWIEKVFESEPVNGL